MKPTRHTFATTLTLGLSPGDLVELDCSVVYTFIPGTDDHYNRPIGTWEPGDAPEIEIEHVDATLEPGLQYELPNKLVDKLNNDELFDALHTNALEGIRDNAE